MAFSLILTPILCPLWDNEIDRLGTVRRLWIVLYWVCRSPVFHHRVAEKTVGAMTHMKEIIIVGCGFLGSTLANQLSRSGHSVVVIDRRETAFDRLSSDFSGSMLVGDAVEPWILEKARIDHADCLFAMTTADNTNLMIAQIARVVFHVPCVVARMCDPAREVIYHDLEIDTISSTKLAAESLLKVLA
jgi:trk system potassium uptake protein